MLGKVDREEVRSLATAEVWDQVTGRGQRETSSWGQCVGRTPGADDSPGEWWSRVRFRLL